MPAPISLRGSALVREPCTVARRSLPTALGMVSTETDSPSNPTHEAVSGHGDGPVAAPSVTRRHSSSFNTSGHSIDPDRPSYRARSASVPVDEGSGAGV